MRAIPVLKKLEESILSLCIENSHVIYQPDKINMEPNKLIQYRIKYYTDKEVALQPLHENYYVFAPRKIFIKDFLGLVLKYYLE